VQENAGKSRFLAASLPYTEMTECERPAWDARPLMAVREVAALLGVCAATVYGLCAERRIAHVRVSNAIRVAEEDLAAFIETRRRRG
jgi:excisionase family DNA binding protein